MNTSNATPLRQIIVPIPQRTARVERLRELSLDRLSLKHFIDTHRHTAREQLIDTGHLAPHAPVKGTTLLTPHHRTPAGNALLQLTKDILFALLFGDAHTNTHFHRVERELLTLTLPRAKSHAMGFLQAATELSAAGTWQDPDSVSHDQRAENVILEVEYGEISEEWIGDGIVTTLRLINNLEVNEQILYARMINIEQSTLIA